MTFGLANVGSQVIWSDGHGAMVSRVEKKGTIPNRCLLLTLEFLIVQGLFAWWYLRKSGIRKSCNPKSDAESVISSSSELLIVVLGATRSSQEMSGRRDDVTVP